MAQDATLHVKLDKATDEKLKKLACSRDKSKGQLVREAIEVCYQTSLDDLPLSQRQALAAYQGGYLSLGRLAQVMGMHALALRRWLEEHGIPPAAAYRDEDAGHA
jgi:predicted HTH domain antitoxin